jgi:hypothetical protein
VALVHKTADKIKAIFFHIPQSIEKREFVVMSKKLTNNFMGLVTNGCGLDVTLEPSLGPHYVI